MGVIPKIRCAEMQNVYRKSTTKWF
uniref:Uncharacterized protein n=1 Tax=Anguilla anguilla TaxID=7936 RepID=A0A0E9U6S6_ANGAN